MVSSAETWCGGASSRRAPSSMPAGYASQTGYQYDSISRVAGQRELAPPSKFSKEGGFRRSVLRDIIISSVYHFVTEKRLITRRPWFILHPPLRVRFICKIIANSLLQSM